MSAPRLADVLPTAELVHDRATLAAAIGTMAAAIGDDYAADERAPLFVTIMHGGMPFAAQLAFALGERGQDLEFDYLHATRYRGNTSGSGLAWLHRPATPMEGRRVLLVEPRESARVAAHDLLHDAGMRVDAAASLEQADESLRGGAPDIVVAGLPTTDAGMAALLERARAAQPRLRVVQLVDDDDAFAFSGPGLDDPAQVGRRHMARTLVSAVAQELDAA